MLTALFDGTFDGFLSVVHSSYYDRREYACAFEDGAYQQRLGDDYFYVPADPAKSVKVMEAIGRRISPEAQSNAYHCSLAGDAGRFTAMLHYVRLGFKMGAAVDDRLQDVHVSKVHKLVYYVLHEAHLLSGFCRFAETKGGVYYAAVSPVNNALPILAEHFRDRLMNQPWIIHDTARGMAAVYDCRDYVIGPVPGSAKVDPSSNEELFQGLWKTFFDTIAVKERANKHLQRNLLPLHFRKHMAEFKNGGQYEHIGADKIVKQHTGFL